MTFFSIKSIYKILVCYFILQYFQSKKKNYKYQNINLKCIYKWNTNGSGKKRLSSINNPAKNPNQTAAKTGAVDKYFVKFCIIFSIILRYIYI